MRVGIFCGTDFTGNDPVQAFLRRDASLLDRLSAFPVTSGQLTMLAAHNTGDPTRISQLTDRKPKAFNACSLTDRTAVRT